MKIVHLAPNSPYNDYWGYQDNLLPKYQRKMGHDIIVITTTLTHKNGKVVTIAPTHYFLEDGVEVYRLPYKQYKLLPKIISAVAAKLDAYSIIDEFKPDYIFHHGLVSCTIFDAVRYKKNNPNCIIRQDNHWDYNIGNKSRTVKEKMLRCWYRMLNRLSVPYIDKIYGVTPWRQQYAIDYFRIPENKTDVLIMGADDEKLRFNEMMTIRHELRDKYQIKTEEFLIVTGGKLDSNKKVIELMEACSELENVKVLIFGEVLESIRVPFNETLNKTQNCCYIGWIDADKVYDFFFAADLVCFPGQHSVLWEQACASKVPCVFAKWNGMDHVNNGGNCEFFENLTVDGMTSFLKELINSTRYKRMLEIAQSPATNKYLYSEIAKKSLESIDKNQ